MAPRIKFKCQLGDHDIEGDCVNPGGWRGHIWLIQIGIANNLAPFVAVEAASEQSAIDELADSVQLGYWINMEEGDVDPDDEEVCRAGNDGHPVDLDNVHIQEAPSGFTYFLEWPGDEHDVSSILNDAVEEFESRLEEWT